MKRFSLVALLVLGLALTGLSQTTSPDSQTSQALLLEVRGLRQELQLALGQIHVAQILLSRLQMQEIAVTRASQHLDDARSKLAEVQVVINSESAEIRHLEEGASSGERTAQIEEAINSAKSDLEASTSLQQQRQAIETDAEQQLLTEQDKLNKLEAQLDEAETKIERSNNGKPPVPH
jgi:DNA repair exonuclease SbcCD ATPase subunit